MRLTTYRSKFLSILITSAIFSASAMAAETPSDTRHDSEEIMRARYDAIVQQERDILAPLSTDASEATCNRVLKAAEDQSRVDLVGSIKTHCGLDKIDKP